jgi:hypothetical protein
MVVGRGVGGLVSVLAAAVVTAAGSASVSALAVLDMPVSIRSLVEAERYRWPEEAFVGGILEVCDIPELLAEIAQAGARVLVINPLDGSGNPYHGAVLDQVKVRTVAAVGPQGSTAYLQAELDAIS